MGSGRRRALLALLCAAVVGGSGAAAVVLPDDAGPAAAPAPTPLPSRGPLLAPVADGAPLPTAAGLQALVDAAAADPGVAGRLSVSVVDAATGEPLLERSADVPLVPASTAKIATAVAVLTGLDPELRLATRVVAGAAPGEVVLVGGGDPTLAGPAAVPGYPAPATLADLAARARTALGATAVTRVLVDESLYTGERLGPGWKPTYVTEGAVAPVGPLMVDGGRVRPDRVARHADPALAAGRALAALLQPGAEVEVARGTAAPAATVLGEVLSPPVAALTERMLVRSDNDLAEALVRHLAIARGLPASFAGGAEAVRQVLGARGEGVALVDGSGLSRDDRLTPAAVTRLLVQVDDEERLAPVLTGLPVAGFSGTLADRYGEDEPGRTAAGVVRAKTGTLSGVSALAGLVRTREGRLLAFDVTADGVPAGATRQAEAALDRLAAALAACGCR